MDEWDDYDEEDESLEEEVAPCPECGPRRVRGKRKLPRMWILVHGRRSQQDVARGGGQRESLGDGRNRVGILCVCDTLGGAWGVAVWVAR